ncbi:MAG: hypothetical protein ACK4SF_04360 [Algoriphagus aquaeductus]|uniref:hypothetical protein n=1 Tax=Algoriphagus aquaeductus TaxID=475299 RepID=UPI00391DB73A
MSTRAQLSETINRLLPGEQNKRIREAILAAASYSGSRTDQLRQSIDLANRLQTGRLIKGEITFDSDTEAELSGYVWVIDFQIFQPTTPTTLTVTAPHPTVERTDLFTGDDAGVIRYYPGSVDALGNSFFPSIPTGEVILEVVTRNPDSSNTVDPGTPSVTDWISKSATALQQMAGPLAISPLAGAIQDLIGTDPNGMLRRVPASRAGVYTTREGDGGFTSGWSKILRITIEPALQINYVITFQVLGVTPTYEKGDMWVIFLVDEDGDIITNSLQLFGSFTPARYKLVKVDNTHYELYLAHDQIDSLYSFRPIMLFGNDWRYEFFQQEEIVENLPAGDQYSFTLFGGLDGREVELRNSGTAIEWRYVGDPDWVNLVDLEEITGQDGDHGLNGWTPVFAVLSDGERRVLQVVDWVGGTGTKPTTGLYVGADGLKVSIGDGVDIRGPQGPAGSGGGGSGTYITDLDTWPVLKFDQNYRYVHEMTGPVEISAQLISPLAVTGNFCKLYIKANGVNKPTFTGDFEVIWDNWVNTAGHWNRLFAEYTPEGKVILQIEQAHLGTANDGTGSTTVTVKFDANYVQQHVVTTTTQIVIDTTGAQVGFETILYIKSDGVNKPFWDSDDVVVTYDNYLNLADVWNRFKLEWRPENKAILQIINT